MIRVATCCRICPKANYNVWVRGYGLTDSPKTKATPGQQLALKAIPAPSPRVAAEYYPAQYWLSLLQVPPASDFPGTGPIGNGISHEREKPGRVDSQHRQHRRVHGLPSDGQQGDARDSREPRQVRALESRVGSPGSVRPGRSRHGRAVRPGRSSACAGDVGGLDRSHCGWRVAGISTLPAAGPRAERRRDAVGLGGSEGVSARRDRQRQTQSHRERKRSDLWRARSQRGLHATRPPDATRGDAGEADGARPEDAERGGYAARRGLCLLG